MASPLQNAIRAGSLSAVVAALEAGADIEELDLHGCPGLPLRSAAFFGQNSIVVELIRRGADLHAWTHEGDGGAIRSAVRGKHPETVRLLLEQGALPPQGLALGLSQEEIFKAQLVATLSQRVTSSVETGDFVVTDHAVHELDVSMEDLATLFR